MARGHRGGNMRISQANKSPYPSSLNFKCRFLAYKRDSSTLPSTCITFCKLKCPSDDLCFYAILYIRFQNQ